jgi:type I restriction enzyme S subunit
MAAGKSKPTSQIMTEPFEGCYPCFGGNGIRGYVDEYNQDGIFSIVGRQGALCGNINIAMGKFYATEHAVVTTLFSGIDFNWSNYTLEALHLNNYATGAAQPGLSVANVLNVFVPVPPTQEQIQIGIKISDSIKIIETIENEKLNLQTVISIVKSKILDLAIRGQLVPQDPNDEPASVLLERIRAEKEELIKAGKIKRDKKESVIFRGEDNSYYETIDKNTICIDDEIHFNIPNGWAWCRLQSISSILTDGTHKTPEYSDSGYMFLSSKNVTSGKIDWENVMYIPDYLHEELYERLAPAKDDILIAKNGTTGIAAIVDRNAVFDIYVSLALIRIVNNLVFPPYVLYAIGSPYVQEYFNSSLKGIGVPNLHLEHIRKTLIPIPPHSEQKQIAELLKNIFLKMDDVLNILT